MSSSAQSLATHESLASVWGRRLLSLPLYFSLTALALGALPLWLPTLLLWDLVVPGRKRLPRTRALLFFTHYLLCECWGVCAAALLWLGTLGATLGGPARFLALNAGLQRAWTRSLFAGAKTLFAWTVELEGAELAREGPMLLFVRHSSAADTVLAACFVANPHGLLLRYVLKRELLWDPCLDIVGRRLPNSFVDRKSKQRDAELEAIAALARGLDSRSAALIDPEGTRFSERKLAHAKAQLEAQGQTELRALAEGFTHVLPPKLGGPLRLLQAAPNVDLVWLEHTGFEGAASFRDFWNGALVGATLRIRLRRTPAKAVPSQQREQWLYREWLETNRWIAQQLQHPPQEPKGP